MKIAHLEEVIESQEKIMDEKITKEFDHRMTLTTLAPSSRITSMRNVHNENPYYYKLTLKYTKTLMGDHNRTRKTNILKIKTK